MQEREACSVNKENRGANAARHPQITAPAKRAAGLPQPLFRLQHVLQHRIAVIRATLPRRGRATAASGPTSVADLELSAQPGAACVARAAAGAAARRRAAAGAGRSGREPSRITWICHRSASRKRLTRRSRAAGLDKPPVQGKPWARRRVRSAAGRFMEQRSQHRRSAARARAWSWGFCTPRQRASRSCRPAARHTGVSRP